MPKYWVEDVNGTKVLHEYEDGSASDPVVPASTISQSLAKAPGSVVAAATLSTNFVTVGNGFTTIPAWQIVVPANSGIVEVGVPEGLLYNINTGTNAAGTKFGFEARIVDEGGVQIGYSQQAFYSNATGQIWVGTIPIMHTVANNAAAKTYSIQCRMATITASAASTVFTSQSGFTDPTLRAIRR